MARSTRSSSKSKTRPASRRTPWRRALVWLGRAVLGVAGVLVALVLLFTVINPPTNIYQMQESRRLGKIERDWVAFDQIAPSMARAAVAAEDANYCLHWGFDMAAIRAALDAGARRGASTISQQVVKNVFLWHGQSDFSRSARKGFEAVLTLLVEAVWSKRRILEVYLNVAEFGEGVFGIEAASQHYFGRAAKDLTAIQSARLAAVLPAPKSRNPAKPTPAVERRAQAIISGAETIAVDGRAGCFQP